MKKNLDVIIVANVFLKKTTTMLCKVFLDLAESKQFPQGENTFLHFP